MQRGDYREEEAGPADYDVQEHSSLITTGVVFSPAAEVCAHLVHMHPCDVTCNGDTRLIVFPPLLRLMPVSVQASQTAMHACLVPCM